MGLRKYSESAISDPHNQTPDCDDESLSGAKNIVGIGIWLLRRYQICRVWRQMAYKVLKRPEANRLIDDLNDR